MPKSEELQKHTLNLFPGDYERIQQLHPDIGAGPIIRRLVRAYLDRIDGGEQSKLSDQVEVEI